jgi:hypothetical protein
MVLAIAGVVLASRRQRVARDRVDRLSLWLLAAAAAAAAVAACGWAFAPWRVAFALAFILIGAAIVVKRYALAK